jgi:tRNA threonylcarbamoyladenosine biosynthesis protein TsaE
MQTQSIVTRNTEETKCIGRQWALQLQPGDCLILIGALGAGKTTLVQGIAQGLGIAGPIVSPTFTLMREYQGRLPFTHVDAYRIKNLDELREIGLEDCMLAEGIVAIEWGEKALPFLPRECIEVRIDLLPDQQRKISIGKKS